MEDERRDELNESVKRARLINRLVESEGWTDIVRPALEGKKELYLSQFREAKELDEFVIAQQSINAIDWLFGFIESTLAMGEDSVKELKKEP